MLNELKTELDEVFTRQLQDLLRNRHIFRQVDEAWKRNIDSPRAVALQGFIWQGYLAFACTAVRKMVDRDLRSVSLWQFLKKLKEPATLVAARRSEFVKRYTNGLIRQKCADRDFDEVTRGEPELSDAVIERDIAEIEGAVTPIKGLVDTVIAHSDRTQLGATLNDLDAAIDTLAAVYDRYALLIGVLTGGGLIRKGGIAFDDVKRDIARLWT